MSKVLNRLAKPTTPLNVVCGGSPLKDVVIDELWEMNVMTENAFALAESSFCHEIRNEPSRVVSEGRSVNDLYDLTTVGVSENRAIESSQGVMNIEGHDGGRWYSAYHAQSCHTA